MPAFFGRREGGRVVIEGDDARHLARSLRAKPGELIDVVDPAGRLLTVRLDGVAAGRVEGEVVAEREHRPEPGAHITIAIANLPATSLELVLARCTEAGACDFIVFQAERSVGRGARSERWAAICREAAMLAARTRVPGVSTAASVAEVLAARPDAVMLVRESPMRLADLAEPSDVTLLVGPEGGWTARELELANATASLGPRNLRADTAALVALSITLAVRGD